VARTSTSVKRTRVRANDRPLRVLRIHQSGVVSSWRARDRELRARGVDVTLVSAARWNEGGRDVVCEPGSDDFVVIARTVGRKPNLCLYDPRPLWKALRSGPFDLIDVHHEPCSLATFEILVLRRLAGAAASVTLYSAQNIFKRYPPPFRWMERKALRTAAGVHVCNEAAAGILRRKGFSGPIEVIPLGIDVERFHPEPSPNAQAGRLAIGYVGRLESYKGVDVLVDAVAGQRNWRLDVVGDGPMAAELRRRADPLGGQVAISGGIATEDLPAVYRSFDVVVIPSRETPTWTEQFCRVAVEAMATGVPIVASATGALPEVVGDAGVFVPQGDPVALRCALAELAADPARRRALGQIGRASSQRFAWAAVAERQHRFYEAILA